MKPIRLHEPNILGNEFSYVNECLKDNWVSTSGKYVELFEKKISKYTNSKYSICQSLKAIFNHFLPDETYTDRRLFKIENIDIDTEKDEKEIVKEKASQLLENI